MGPRLTDFPLRCQLEPTIFDDAALALRKVYVRHTTPPLASLERSYQRTPSADWERHDVACGHDMMLESPEIADLLVEITGSSSIGT